MKTKLFLALLFISSIAFAQFPTNGLTGEYSFTGGGLVDGANSNNFTQTGTALTTLDNRFASANDAISLNGDYLTRTDINYPTVGIDRDSGTVSFWIKTTTNSSDVKTIIDDSAGRDSATDNTWAGYYVYLKDGKVGVTVVVRYNTLGLRGFGVLSSQIISDGNWHHVAFTMYNGAQFTGSVDVVTAGVALYIDGVAAGNDGVSNASTGSIFLSETNDTPGNITIGNNRGNNLPTINKYQDTVDDVLFYGRRLSPTEIADITNYSFCFAIDSSSISILNKTTTSFDVSWQENGDFELAYVLSGQPIASATVITVNGHTAGSLENISGLTEGTTYDVYVREKCTATTYSAWSIALPVRTQGKIFVKVNATGANNGDSWADAFTSLQDAIAVSEVNQEIWMAEGVYKAHASDREVYYEITKNGTTIYGGFNGTETQLFQRDFRTYETILSGDLLGNDNSNITLNEPTRSDNSAKIIRVSAHDFTLDGITISDGEGFVAGNAFFDSGTAITNALGVNNLTIENSTFKNNVARKAAACVFAIYGVNGFLKVTNSIFSNNVAEYGTSFYSYTLGAASVTVTIENSLFENNLATNLGGSAGFAGSAGWFRAFSNTSSVTASFVNNTYTNNRDEGTSGGLNNFTRATLGLSQTDGTMTANVDNCIFWNNKTGNATAIARAITGISSTLGNITVSNSIDENDFSTIPSGNTTNTSNADPLFANSTNDFTLQTGSPAIDTGNNAAVATILGDLLGNARIFNTTVDMGVYEFGSSPLSNYTLTTSVNGNGSVSPSGTATYIENTIIPVTATPAAGYQFDNWSGDSTSTNPSINITMDANKTLTANFSVAYTLTVNVVGNGTVTLSPPGGAYSNGDIITVTATPGTDSFLGWSGDITGNTNPTQITIDGSKTITAFFGTILFVKRDATGNNTGNSWADAFTNLEDALLVATSDTEIWVASGTYIPTTTSTNPRDATFLIPNGVELYGGFNGTETLLSQRNPLTNVTTLSGDLSANDNTTLVQTEPTRQDNSYHVVSVRGSSQNVIVDGFTISGGNANGALLNSCALSAINQADNRRGAAVYANPYLSGNVVSALFSNCILEKNTATSVSVYTMFSPCGIQNLTADVDFESCIIRANHTRDLATMAFIGLQQFNIFSRGSIVNSVFYNNTSLNNASGVYLGVSSGGTAAGIDVGIFNTTFSNNTGVNGNVIIMNKAQNSSIRNSIIFGNGSNTPILSVNGTSVTSNNIFEGGQLGNLNSNPLFTNSSINDYTLQAGSPAIDSGDNNLIPAGIVADLLQNDRIFNSIVDMGCYEYGASSVVSVNDIETALSIGLYPNPVKDVLNIVMNDNLNQVDIYNLQGQKVKESNTKQINVSNLSKGIYLIKVTNENGNVTTKKFIKM